MIMQRRTMRGPRGARTGGLALAIFIIFSFVLRSRTVPTVEHSLSSSSASLRTDGLSSTATDRAPSQPTSSDNSAAVQQVQPPFSSLTDNDLKQQHQQITQQEQEKRQKQLEQTQNEDPKSLSSSNDRPGLLSSSQQNKTLDCASPIRLGDDYGGWQLCRPQKDSFNGQLVYTIGIGRNIKWDMEMISKYGTVHHGWDPTPTAVDFFSKTPIPSGFTFHKYGLGSEDGNLTLKLPHGNFDSYTIMSYWQKAKTGTVVTVPILTVRSMMEQLSHTHLAILKIDIEGAEFDVIKSWERENFHIPADQVLMEFHERYFSHERGYRSKVGNAVDSMARLGFDLIVRTNLECTFARRDAIALRKSGVIKGK